MYWPCQLPYIYCDLDLCVIIAACIAKRTLRRLPNCARTQLQLCLFVKLDVAGCYARREILFVLNVYVCIQTCSFFWFLQCVLHLYVSDL